MNFLLPNMQYIQMEEGEHGRVVDVPREPYYVLKEDFAVAEHLEKMDAVNFKNSSGIYIRAKNKTDGLIAAMYAYKRYMAQNNANYPSALHLFRSNFETLEDDECHQLGDDGAYIIDDEELLQATWADGSYKQLPIINHMEFISYYNSYFDPYTGVGGYAQRRQAESERVRPYWADVPAPLIIYTTPLNLENVARALEVEPRFVLLVEAENEQALQYFMMFGNPDEKRDEGIPDSLKNFLFETNIEYVPIAQVKTKYLTTLLQLLTVNEGYTLGNDVNCEEVVQQLLHYRKLNFQSATDVRLLIQKAIRYTEGRCIDVRALKRFFLNQQTAVDTQLLKASTAYNELHRLIGLDNVKSELVRLVERLRFTALRRQAGQQAVDHHLAAIFAGSPGTCKTTVARIFGQLLFEANVLTNSVFIEVSRKDLVGQYVGWTAPKVQEVFDQAKGGTIFIDEAYSLNPASHKDGFSEEALATIIQCMENNPNTLVIFAGYTEKMMHFVQHANPGLRSRLTNIIQFDDYSVQELIAIFYYHLKQSGYTIRQRAQVDELLQQFITKMQAFSSTQQGNGRLMRKLVSTAIGFMAMRRPKNMNLLTKTDIAASCEELLKAEMFLQQKTSARIGFNR